MLPGAGRERANLWGVQELHGLIWEWVLDFGALAPNPSSGGSCGGDVEARGDKRDYASFMREAFRSSLQANYTTSNLGFRCARDLAPGVKPLTAAPGESLYQLPGRFTDSRGATVELAATRGHPTLVTMFYGSCPQACPLLISKIKLAERALPEAERQDLRVTLVTIDPERDTPEVLAKLAAAHGVDGSRWRFLRTDAATVQLLAATLGIRYHRLNTGGFWHSSVVVVLDRQGRIAGRVEGLALETAPLVTSIDAARR